MDEFKFCNTCKWWGYMMKYDADKRCCNIDSPYVVNTTLAFESCDEWESKKDG